MFNIYNVWVFFDLIFCYRQNYFSKVLFYRRLFFKKKDKYVNIKAFLSIFVPNFVAINNIIIVPIDKRIMYA